jgi:DNA-binding MarR family transcriptional regulator
MPDPVGDVQLEDYRRLAEFRYRIRRFLAFSEGEARAAGLEPQQHQLMLAACGIPEGVEPTIGALAERLQIQHHSAVELVSRLEERGMVRRVRSTVDRRRVMVVLTPAGEQVLRELSRHHLQELRTNGPVLIRALTAIVDSGRTAALPPADVDASDSAGSGDQPPVDVAGRPLHVLAAENGRRPRQRQRQPAGQRQRQYRRRARRAQDRGEVDPGRPEHVERRLQ